MGEDDDDGDENLPLYLEQLIFSGPLLLSLFFGLLANKTASVNVINDFVDSGTTTPDFHEKN